MKLFKIDNYTDSSVKSSFKILSFSLLIFLFVYSFFSTTFLKHAEAKKFYTRKDRAIKDFDVPLLTDQNIEQILTDTNNIKRALIAEGSNHDDAEVISCNYISERLSGIKRNLKNASTKQARELGGSYLYTMRVLYSLKAGLVEQQRSGLLEKIKSPLIMGIRIMGSPFIIRIPKENPDNKVGRLKADNEAHGLWESKEKRVDRNLIENMTHREVSKLENGHNSRIFNSFSKLSGIKRYLALESTIQKMTRAYAPEYKDFSIKEAKKVFFFKKVKTTATSPKINVKDKWGLKWKLKWGDEVHTEPFMTRLYVIMGAKYSDLKYYIPKDESILVLQRADKNSDNSNNSDNSKKEKKDKISFLYQLKQALVDSRYNFHVMRYIVPEGLVYDQNKRALGHGPLTVDDCKRLKISRKNRGKYYLRFKECSASFYSPVVKRIGPASFSDLGAQINRTARGSVLFNCMFNNKDCKDDNNRLAIIYNPRTDAYDRVVEYQHDLGCTLGNLKTSGNINAYKWDFITKFPGHLGFKLRALYYPNAWKMATFADAMWMARKITDIPINAIKWCLKESGWPSYSQALLFEKIMSRRNELIDVFSLDEEGYQKLPVNKRLTIETVDINGNKDYPVKNGKISSPDDSSIVKKDEAEFHPEGLYEVIPRSKD